eukprot:GHVH01008286.1.p1 GENE.GHVH01008286.1~~GHVH01008286.1.p1  ORF type:complete len:895 (+),score=150.59 GHVH01008286.1:61-2745(+)
MEPVLTEIDELLSRIVTSDGIDEETRLAFSRTLPDHVDLVKDLVSLREIDKVLTPITLSQSMYDLVLRMRRVDGRLLSQSNDNLAEVTSFVEASRQLQIAHNRLEDTTAVHNFCKSLITWNKGVLYLLSVMDDIDDQSTNKSFNNNEIVLPSNFKGMMESTVDTLIQFRSERVSICGIVSDINNLPPQYLTALQSLDNASERVISWIADTCTLLESESRYSTIGMPELIEQLVKLESGKRSHDFVIKYVLKDKSLAQNLTEVFKDPDTKFIDKCNAHRYQEAVSTINADLVRLVDEHLRSPLAKVSTTVNQDLITAVKIKQEDAIRLILDDIERSIRAEYPPLLGSSSLINSSLLNLEGARTSSAELLSILADLHHFNHFLSETMKTQCNVSLVIQPLIQIGNIESIVVDIELRTIELGVEIVVVEDVIQWQEIDVHAHWVDEPLIDSSFVSDLFFLVKEAIISISNIYSRKAMVKLISLIQTFLESTVLPFVRICCSLSLSRFSRTITMASSRIQPSIDSSKVTSDAGTYIPWFEINDETSAMWASRDRKLRLKDIFTNDELIKCDMFSVNQTIQDMCPRLDPAMKTSKLTDLTDGTDLVPSTHILYPLALNNISFIIQNLNHMVDMLDEIDTTMDRDTSTLSSQMTSTLKIFDDALDHQIQYLITAMKPALAPCLKLFLSFKWTPDEAIFTEMSSSFGSVVDDGCSLWPLLVLSTLDNINQQICEACFDAEVLKQMNKFLICSILRFIELFLFDSAFKDFKFSCWGASILESDIQYLARTIASLPFPRDFCLRDAFGNCLEALEVLNLDSLYEFDELSSSERDWRLDKESLQILALKRVDWNETTVNRYFNNRQFLGKRPTMDDTDQKGSQHPPVFWNPVDLLGLRNVVECE